MKIAILSDIHDNVWKLAAALDSMGEVDTLLCCGDLCSPFIIGQLANGFGGPIHIIFGNNDGDLYRITQNAQPFEHVTLHGHYFQDTFDGKRFAMNHYPDIAGEIAASGKFEVVCYGHNHDYKIEPVGSILTINPGPIMGFNPIKKTDVASTFVIYDTRTGKPLSYQVGPSGEVSRYEP
ncbi:MAG TPA: metallophosphoesterase family protein [Anaerolineae bacterium]